MQVVSHVALRQVLVVEDDPLSAVLATEALSLMGCEASLTSAGDDAVELMASRHFDLVFMDYHLPRLNGLDATVQIRSREVARNLPRTPIVGLTASAMPGEREACFRAGMDDVLLKPFQLEQLNAMVERWCKPT